MGDIVQFTQRATIALENRVRKEENMGRVFEFPKKHEEGDDEDVWIVGPCNDDIERKYTEDWDRFQKLAEDSYTWRDHETLDELLQVIGELRPWILRAVPEAANGAEV